MKYLIANAILMILIGAPIMAEQTHSWKNTDGLYAVFDTSNGKIVCRLFEKETPVTVENFIGLAEGKKEFLDPKTRQKTTKRFYDGLTFHRVIPEFMIQGGCPLGTGTGGPGYNFADEIVPDLKFDKPGLLAMANAGPGTNGSQFFITEVATPWLNGHHTIFGEVVEGMQVVKDIAHLKRGAMDKPATPVILKKLSIQRVGKEAMPSKDKQGKLSGKKILFLIAPKSFRDEEYFEPKKILEAEGAQTVTASLSKDEATGMLGGKAKPDIILGDVKASDFDAILFIGGEGATVYWNNQQAQQLARDAVSANKVLGAICLAPGTIANAGVLKGKNATCFLVADELLQKGGAKLSSKYVEQDGKIITASGPEAAIEFGNAVLKELGGTAR